VSQSIASWHKWHRDRKWLQELAHEDPKDVGEYLFTLYAAGSDVCDLMWEKRPTLEVFYYQFRYRHISVSMVAAITPHKKTSTERFEAICNAYFKASLFIEPFALGVVQSEKAIPSALSRAALADLAGYVGASLNTGNHWKLKKALSEEGGNSPQKRRDVLLGKLPAATLLAWEEVLANGDPLAPGKRKRNLVSRAADFVVKDGRESLTKEWLADESVREALDNDHPDLSAENTELQGFVLEEELRAMLPEREYQVMAMQLKNYTFPEIAKELKIAQGNAKKTMYRARAKLREFREAAAQ
jgi:hypothetical protein